MTRPSQRVLLVASTGGHWTQLLRLQPAYEGFEPVYVSTSNEDRSAVPGCQFHAVPDASSWNKVRMLWLALRMLWLVLVWRPFAVVTTGAAPGYFAIRFGKWVGARTLWLDSVANAEELSLSGRLAGRYADLWLTQWPHLARDDGPRFRGVVL